ncbi:hypothetical protein ABGB07_28750 [Micromonosporaceae bacterium B7E4]
MDIPEPPDPSGLWEEVKALANPWPQDSETQAYALADVLEPAAGVIERAKDDIQAIARQLFTLWSDMAGFKFAETLRVLDAEHLPLVLVLRELAKGAREYGRTIIETKISIWIEIGANAALFVALSPIPGGSASVAARVAGRLATLITERAGQVAASGPLQAARQIATQAILGSASEAGNAGTTQLISMATGNRDQFDVKDVLVAGVAGAGGEVAGDALRRGATGAITEAVERGLERIGVPGPIASHPAIAAEAIVNNGLTSPTASYAADNAVNGNWAALTDVDGYLTAVRDGGLSAGLMGAGAANTLHLGMQLNQLGSAPTTVPAGGTGSMVPADGLPPSNQPAALPDRATAPASPDQAAGPPATAAGRPDQAVGPPVDRAVTPPVGDTGSVGPGTNEQGQSAPPATSTAPPAAPQDAGTPGSMPSDAGTTGSDASGPTRSETAGPAVSPSQPSGPVAVHQPETVAPGGASGTSDAPVDGAAEAGPSAGSPPGGGAPGGGAPDAGPSAAGPSEGNQSAVGPAAGGPSAGGSGPAAGGPPPVGASAGSPSAPITAPATHTTVHPTAYSAPHPTGPVGAGTSGPPPGQAPVAPTVPAGTGAATVAPTGPAAPPYPAPPGAPTVVPTGPATNPGAPGTESGTGRGRNGATASSPGPTPDGGDRQAEPAVETASPAPARPALPGTPVVPDSAAAGALATAAPAVGPVPSVDSSTPPTPPTHPRLTGPPAPVGRAAGPDTTTPAVPDARPADLPDPDPADPTGPPDPDPTVSDPADRAATPTDGPGTAPNGPDPVWDGQSGDEGHIRPDEFVVLDDEYERLDTLLDAELERHGLRRDPDSDLVRVGVLDGQDPRGVLVGALAARAFGGGDVRTELAQRLPGARFDLLHEGLGNLSSDQARQVFTTDVGDVLDTLGHSGPDRAAYLVVTDSNGQQRGYALLSRSRDGERVVLGYDPQTGREAAVAGSAPDTVPVEDFLGIRSPVRSEVMILGDRPISWDDPRIPESVRALRAEQQAVESEGYAAVGRGGGQPTEVMQSGGSIRPRDVFDMTAQNRWAAHAYDRFRSDPTDVAQIAENLAQVPREDGSAGFSAAEIQQVKEHLFVNEHLLNVYDDNGDVVGHRTGRFDPDADIAEAWVRLRRAEPLPQDVLLLEHELRELRYAAEHPEATYAEAHAHANERFNWERNIPERTGEDLDGWGYRDGDTATLPQDGGDRPGGPLPLRLSGTGPEVDHQQAGPDVPGDGPAGGPRLQSGGTTNPGPGGRGEDLAAGGRDPVLARGPGGPGPHPGPQADNSHTATELPGAPAHDGPSAPRPVFRMLTQALREHGPLTVDRRNLTATLRLPGRPPLRFRVGTPPEGKRSHRSDVVIGGETHVDVVVSASAPTGSAGARWAARVVGHELDEDAALRNESFVTRAKAKLRSLSGEPAHPDALRRGADPSRKRLSPHDEGHRAEVKLLVAELTTAKASAASGSAVSARAVKDIEVELGLLLDHLGIGHPDPNAPDARHARHRLGLLNLSIDESATVRRLSSHDAEWRSPERRVAQLARTGEVATIELRDGTPVPVRFSRRQGGSGTGFTVNPPSPRPGPDGVPVRGPDGLVLTGPAEVVFDRQANIPELAQEAIERLRTELEPPTFVPWMSRVNASPQARVNTSAESTRLRGAYFSAKTAIEDGLAAVDGHRLFLLESTWPVGPPWNGEGHVVWVDSPRQERRADDGPLAVVLRLGPLPTGQAYRVEPVADPGPGTARQVRVVVAETVAADVDALKTIVAEAVLRAVETVQHGDARGRLAAVEQAHRMGDEDRVLELLAEAELLSDQPGSRRHVKGLRNWLAGRAEPAIALRMFDTRATPNDSKGLKVLDLALDRAAADFTPVVRGARIRDLSDPVAFVRIGDSSYQVPVKPTGSDQRDFAVRLDPDPGAPHGYRLLVRPDASEAAILVETADALAEFATLGPRAGSGQAVDRATRGAAGKAGRDARVRVLTSLYRVATPAERIMIERYVDATMPDLLSGTIKHNLRESAGRRRARIDQSLVARAGRKPYWPPMFRRLVSSVGSGGNTLMVGLEFGRDPVGIATSVASGFANSVAQADADARLGSALPTVRLVTDPDRSLVGEARKPPKREQGDPIAKNLQKRTPAALAGSGATAAVQSSGGDVQKTAAGGAITLGASLLQAVADKAADPHEFDATRKRAALEKQEPDTVRNIWAENVYHRVRTIYDDDPTLDADLERELKAARGHLEEAIKESEAEVKDKIEALRRRRSVIVQPARTLWNHTGGRVSDSWKFDPPPGLTYDLVHLPKARAALPVNPLRVGSQQALMQVASLYLGFATTPELLTANMLMQAGRGLGYGAGWTPLSAWEADDRTAAAAARALYQLRESKQMIDELLVHDRHPENHPGVPAGRLAIFKQVQQDRSATVIEGEDGITGIPQEQSVRSQSVKHVTGLAGGLAAAAPLLGVGIPIGDEMIWLVGQAGYTAAYAAGEGVMRVVSPIIKRIDADAQLRAEADRIPFTPLHIAQDLNRMARNAAEAAKQITPMPRPADERASLPSRFTKGAARAGVGGWRLFTAGTALRPGDNPPGPVLLDRQDAVAVNRLVEHARYLHRIAAAEQQGQRIPVGLKPVMLRGYLRLEMERLGLLVEQAGSTARWDAVTEDARLRFGLDLNGRTELGMLRGEADRWPADTKPKEVMEFVAEEREGDKVGYGVTRAIEVMTREGWFSSDPNTPGGVRQLRLVADNTVRVSTDHGRFELRVESRENGADGGLAVLEPRSSGAHQLYVDRSVIADPQRLATVLRGAADTWLADRFSGAAALVLRDPAERWPAP